MARKKKEVVTPTITTVDRLYMMSEYQKNLEKNPEYSLKVDPENKYNMSDLQKTFIEHFVQFKSLPVAAQLCQIDLEQATDLYNMYSSKEEIRRINKALYARQFSKKMLSLEEIGGWLSSLLTDENVPYADRLKSTDKLRVASMLIDLNNAGNQALENPETFMHKNFEAQVKSLSLESIRQLIDADTSLTQKHDIIAKMNVDKRLTAEDISFLETLSMDELLKLLEKMNGKA